MEILILLGYALFSAFVVRSVRDEMGSGWANGVAFVAILLAVGLVASWMPL